MHLRIRSSNTSHFLVLSFFVYSAVRWFPAKIKEKEPSSLTGAKSQNSLDIRQFLLDYHRLKKQAEGCLEEEDEKLDTGRSICHIQYS